MSETSTQAPQVAPPKPAFSKGLVGIVAAQTKLSHPDSPNSKLTYAGYAIEDLAANVSYEEVAHLLLEGTLPTKLQLKAFDKALKANRDLPRPIVKWLGGLPKTAVPMEVLRTAVSMLAFHDPEIEDISIEATKRKAVRLISQFPIINAAFHRLRNGDKPVRPNKKLGHAAFALNQLTGQDVDVDFARGMNAYFVLLADHSLNASTFTTRVVASTEADLHSCITAAIGALKGPLHGGANEATMNMLNAIGEPGQVDAWIDDAFAHKRKIMGFGHRIYRNGDPRARVLNELSEAQGAKVGGLKWFKMSEMVETAVTRNAHARGRELYPNVDFYSASLLFNLGIPLDMMTPYFAAARIAGWSAHVVEQYQDAALIRPASEYVGLHNLTVKPIARRRI